MLNSLVDVFKESAGRFAKQRFYSKDEHKYFKPRSFASLVEEAEWLGMALMGLGVEPGSNVALFADNRVEWLLADMAIQMNGAVVVPRGSDSTVQELAYILDHCQAEVVFLEHARLYKKVAPILEKTKVKHVIILDAKFALDVAFLRIQDLIEIGHDKSNEKTPELRRRMQSIKGDDLFTIIYTSGTTGNPKGVMLTHANMLYQLKIMPEMMALDKTDRVLSVLPIWHIFERALEYVVIHAGGSLYYSSSKDLKEDFIKVKPTFMGSAPRMWESIYYRLKERVDRTEALNRELFDLSYDIKKELHRSSNYLSGNELRLKHEGVLEKIGNQITAAAKAAFLYLPDRYLDSIFLARVRAILGGELRGTISGGGALPAHIDEFFNAIGIPVYEGYGMTECSPLIAARKRGRVVQGSVGFVPEGTTVKVVDEKGQELPVGQTGVIKVKGPGVMRGYYKDAANTQKVLQDGWLDTGDLGLKSTIGTITIKGRAKDTVVLLGGENVEPVPIEMMLTELQLIEQAVIVGQDKKHLSVLIWPNYDRLEDAGYEVEEFDHSEDLNKRKEIVELFTKLIRNSISEENGFKSFERVTSFRFLPDRLRVGKELTNLLKIKRNIVADKYHDLIESMY